MQKLREVVVVAACRTPIGSFAGTLKDIRSHTLGATVLKELIRRTKIDPKIIEDVRFGCCFPDIDAINVARVALLTAGYPDTVPAATINRVCTSGMECVHAAVNQIGIGYADVMVAGGVESMSYQPYLLPKCRFGYRLQDGPCVDRMMRGLHVGSHFVTYPLNGPMKQFQGKPYIMGMTAEFLGEKYKITREEMDTIALRSHLNTERSVKEGRFKDEIAPVETIKKIKGKKTKIPFENDEHFRINTTMEELAKLPPAFIPKVGKVTAGNSSGLNDGASALLLMSREKATQLGLKPLATISGIGIGACAPEIMGISPAVSIRNLMERTGRKIQDYERIELNEAFAAQYLACEKELGLNREVTNVNGSGIGMGHPVGSTGSRIIVSLIYELIHSKKKVGLASICGGGGVSLATEVIVE
jgi:acetyl-CoA C-acetyltransferase